MRTRLTSAAIAVAMLVPVAVLGQDPHQMARMQQMHEQAMRMHESMQAMQHLQTRAQQMEHMMAGEIERMRERAMLQEDEQHRLREQERIRDMAHAMSTAAREMVQAMERARDMMGDPMGPWDAEMHREMERLREHMDAMAGSMDESLGILERMRERVGG